MYRNTRRDLELICMGACLASKQCADRIDKRIGPTGFKIIPQGFIAELIGPERGKRRAKLNAWLTRNGMTPDESVPILDAILGHLEAARKEDVTLAATMASKLAGAVSVEQWLTDAGGK